MDRLTMPFKIMETGRRCNRTLWAKTSMLMVLPLAGCHAEPTQVTPASDTISIGTAVIPQTMDPALSSDVPTEFSISPAYDKLVDFDASGSIFPVLASSWRVEDAGKSLVIRLKSGIKFHSGNALTATDVVFTIDRLKKLGVGAAGFISDYQSSTAPDPYTISIRLSRPNVSFVSALSKVYILDAKLVKSHLGIDMGQSWLSDHDAGSGPYRLIRYAAGQSATFERVSSRQTDNIVRPRNLSFLYLPSSSTIAQQLQAGVLNVGVYLNSSDAKELKAAGFRVTDLPSLLQLYVFMNMRRGVTRDPRIRRAITLAYDYRGHVKTILDGSGAVATGVTTTAVHCRVNRPAFQQDLAAARRLVREAGATGATLTMAYNPALPEQRRAALALQSSVNRTGLRLALRPTTFPEYMSLLTRPEELPDLAMLWDYPNYPEIGPMLARVYKSTQIGQSNPALYSSPAVDSLIDRGLAAEDPGSACAAFQQAQDIILRDQPAMNIANSNIVVVTDKRISGPIFRPANQMFDASTLGFSHRSDRKTQ